MKKRNVSAIQDATVKAFAAQVQRSLDVARIKGWDFPAKCDVAVSITEATPLAIRVKTRIDEVTLDVVVTPTNATQEVVDATDKLVETWLKKHAIKKAS